ncbi:MAG: hypothetical protein OXC44_06435 [Proteobacteria bacterium]|nr:hypothetical protein [Pseudomonadota bacterium]
MVTGWLQDREYKDLLKVIGDNVRHNGGYVSLVLALSGLIIIIGSVLAVAMHA